MPSVRVPLVLAYLTLLPSPVADPRESQPLEFHAILHKCALEELEVDLGEEAAQLLIALARVHPQIGIVPTQYRVLLLDYPLFQA